MENTNTDVSMRSLTLAAIWKGVSSSFLLIAFSLIIVTVISGGNIALEQFKIFWYYFVALAVGFGLQVGLYSYVKNLAKQHVSPGIVAATGTTSTAAMVSCCAHYLVNVIPILGVTGLVTLFAQYQIQFFWVGIAANLFGIAYLLSQVTQYRRYEVK